MPGRNLTRDEARERARLVTVDRYKITLDLGNAKQPDAASFRSSSTVSFSCAEPGASTFLDLIAPRVHEVTLNGRSLDPAAVFADSRVLLSGLEAENEVTVVADCAYSRTGEGLHRFTDPADGQVYLYTQFEPADARRLYANFEQPDLKAVFEFDVAVPAGWHIFSNAAPRERKRVVGGAGRWVFEPTRRISTYITAVVAGPYHVVRDNYTRKLADGTTLEIPLAALCRGSLAQHFDGDVINALAKQGLDFFHDVFGYPYPFGKYDQAFVPEYNLGAMENPGCVTFTEQYVFDSKQTDAAYEGRACTILHEMAHMWFGDLVTMRWWDDLWLKESFADFMGSYAQAAATNWTDAWVSFANRRKAWAYRQDQMPTTHPVVAVIDDLEDAKLNFDGITYAKGASVLKQLVAYVGQEAFLEGARRYFERHAYGNTSLKDLLAVLEETSGRDLAAWSGAWLETAGINTLTLEGGEVVQSGAPGMLQARPHRIAVADYAERGGKVVRIWRREIDVDGPRTMFRSEATTAEFPPNAEFTLVNDEDLSYCKVYLNADQLEYAAARLSDFADPMARSLVWSSLWNMTRDGMLPGTFFIDAVCRHAPAETNMGVLQNLLRQSGTVLAYYLTPERAKHARAAAAETALRETRAAAPGSDQQLLWLRFLAQVTDQDAHLAVLEGLLNASVLLDGLTVDADLRWTLLTALAAAGRADEARLEAELKRDNTANGHRKCAAALAARPSAQAKQEVWRLALDSGDQPNDLVGDMLAAQARPGQLELLRPHVEPYFARLDEVWAGRTIENAERIVTLGFPALLVEDATLGRADRWLAQDGHAPALRRLVAESRDDLARALNARRAA